MKTIFRHMIGLASLLTTCGWLADTSRAAVGVETPMKEAIRVQRTYFLENYSAKADTNSQSAVWLNVFLRDLTNVVDRPSGDWVLALRRLVSLGKQEQLIGRSTGFLEDRQVLEVVIAALKEKDAEARAFAVQTLTWHTREKDLAQSASTIKGALGIPANEDEFLLAGKLALDQQARSEALPAAPPIPQIRARLGDEPAQARLIQHFQAETDYQAKARLARSLGYAGTRACAEALVEALRSDVSTKGHTDQRSIRLDVLLALGQIYQEETLLTRQARLLAENSDSTFDRPGGLPAYIKDIDAWVQRNFGHPAWGDKEVWFHQFLNVPIVLPKPK